MFLTYRSCRFLSRAIASCLYGAAAFLVVFFVLDGAALRATVSRTCATVCAHAHGAARRTELQAVGSRIQRESSGLQAASAQREKLQAHLQELVAVRKRLGAKAAHKREMLRPVLESLATAAGDGLIRDGERVYRQKDVQSRAQELLSQAAELERQLAVSGDAISRFARSLRGLDDRIRVTRLDLDAQQLDLEIQTLRRDGEEAEQLVLSHLHSLDRSH